jgi:hypothetical protein
VPIANSSRWNVVVTSNVNGEISRNGVIVGPPDLDSLNACMREARAGFIVRVEPNGVLHVSASSRSSDVLLEWLQRTVTYEPTDDAAQSPTVTGVHRKRVAPSQAQQEAAADDDEEDSDTGTGQT